MTTIESERRALPIAAGVRPTWRIEHRNGAEVLVANLRET